MEEKLTIEGLLIFTFRGLFLYCFLNLITGTTFIHWILKLTQ